MWIHKSRIAQAYKFSKKIAIFGYPIIYCDREVNDEDDDGAGEDEKDDLTIKIYPTNSILKPTTTESA